MKKHILTGLVMLLPLALTVWIITSIIGWLTGPFVGKYLMMPVRDQIPIMPVEPLIAMKLIAGRHKDRTDIIELAKVRSNLASIVEFTSVNIPHLLPLLNELIICAEEEK